MVCVMTRRDEAFGLDVVQAAMLKAARRMPAMQTDREVEAWMTRVLRTTALDELRRERRRAQREGRAGAPGARCAPRRGPLRRQHLANRIERPDPLCGSGVPAWPRECDSVDVREAFA